MPLLAITSPYPQIFDLDGSPLDNGRIYIGKVDTNPLIESNQIPIYWDQEYTQPAAQPLKTLNGYIVRAGTPAQVFADQAYSAAIYNKRNQLVANVKNGQAGGAIDLAGLLASSSGAGLVGDPGGTVALQLANARAAYARRDVIDFREYAEPIAGIYKTSSLASAIAYCVANNMRLSFVGGNYDFGSSELVVPIPCGITGNGVLRNLKLIVGENGSTVDWDVQIEKVGFAGSAAGSPYGLEFRRGRFVYLTDIRGENCQKLIRGYAGPGSAFHSIGLITVRGANARACGRLVSLENDGGDALSFNDLIYEGNRGWFMTEYGLYADQLDGLQYEANLNHFNRNTATSKNHIRLALSHFVNIGAGNTYFEGGEDCIYIGDTGLIVLDGSNLSAFCGQNAPSSMLKVRTSTFATLHVSGIHAEKPSAHGIDVESTAGGTLVLGTNSANIDLRVGSGANQTYFGSTPLDSFEHYGVRAVGVDVVGQMEVRGLHIDGTGFSSEQKFLAPNADSNAMPFIQGAGSGGYYVAAPISPNVNTSIFQIYDLNKGTALASGVILMTVKNNAETKVSSYVLHYQKSGGIYSLTTISAKEDSTTTADSPRFTNWGTSMSGALQAFSAATTSGTFKFSAAVLGDIRLLLK